MLTAASIRQECEASLSRLEVDTIDLYQIHWPTDRIEDVDEGWGEMARLQQEGKVRWIGVIVYSPMASGLLTGAMTRERIAGLPDDDWRKRDADFQEPALSRHLALVERLRAVGARRGRSPGEVAIAWTLQNPAVTGAIVGARSAKQVEGVMGATGLVLTSEEIQGIEGEGG